MTTLREFECCSSYVLWVRPGNFVPGPCYKFELTYNPHCGASIYGVLKTNFCCQIQRQNDYYFFFNHLPLSRYFSALCCLHIVQCCLHPSSQCRQKIFLLSSPCSFPLTRGSCPHAIFRRKHQRIFFFSFLNMLFCFS